ncbi:MAG: hypothetical protein O6768_09130 [Planctomycetota bacterium]|nr:hypothetical protein [Planctomycetota bacterium]
MTMTGVLDVPGVERTLPIGGDELSAPSGWNVSAAMDYTRRNSERLPKHQ